ncbi:hypothetical protein SRHO_G00104440 [Serrasalmus rhombeus]
MCREEMNNNIQWKRKVALVLLRLLHLVLLVSDGRCRHTFLFQPRFAKHRSERRNCGAAAAPGRVPLQRLSAETSSQFITQIKRSDEFMPEVRERRSVKPFTVTAPPPASTPQTQHQRPSRRDTPPRSPSTPAHAEPRVSVLTLKTSGLPIVRSTNGRSLEDEPARSCGV